MKKLLRIFPIMALAALLLAAAIFCVDGVAHAAGTPRFVIVGKSATDWSLYLETAEGRDLIDSSTDRFFDYGNDEHVASVRFATKMGEWLGDNGYARNDYLLSFELPQFEAEQHGESEIKYSHLVNGGFSLSAFGIESVTNPGSGEGRMSGMLQYRREDENYGDTNMHGMAESAGDPVFFGRGIPVGNYCVRYVVTESVSFGIDGAWRSYDVFRYSSNEFACTIVKDVAPMPEKKAVTITYGTAAGDINASDATGRYELSATQNIEGLTAETYLDVSDSPYDVLFDYISSDVNYLPRQGVSVDVTVMPMPLMVYIGDLYSKVGDPPADISKVEFSTGRLAANDTVADLALEFYLLNHEDDFDKDSPGSYIISARSANKNYSISCVNLVGSPITPGGRYTVYQYVYKLSAPDDRKFTVYLGGAIDGTVRVEMSSLRVQGDIPQGAADFYFESVACYTICFYDSLGNRTYPSGTFTVEWEGEVQGAQYIAYFDSASGATSELASYDPAVVSATLGDISAEGGLTRRDSIAFLKEVTVYPPENVWQWYNILLLVLCCALAFAAAVLAATTAIRRRGLWR